MPARCVLLFCAAAVASAQPVTLYLVPNTHGTVAGWLVNFDEERNIVLNNYLLHLDRVRDDPNYRFAYSEVPNLIGFLEFAPDRVEELKRRVAEKRVEFCNGFFLEPTINLSGGEALVQMGVQGLRWYEGVFGLRPRICWMIDVTGAHRQMPQIVAGLGMSALFFNRNNPTNTAAFWWVSPDGTRTLAVVNRTYAEFGGKDSLFASTEPLSEQQYRAIEKIIEAKLAYSPSKTTLISLAGHGDYSLPPARKQFPTEFLREWARRRPDIAIRFSIPSDYLEALLQEVASGKTRLEEYQGDAGYSWDSFWVNMPEVKQYYRKDEHLLQAAEMLATAASMRGRFGYPSQEFYHCWINMLMNMDRNILWGAGAGKAFKDPEHWDAWDRFTAVEKQAMRTIEESFRVLAGKGDAVTFFNPLNWKRNDPIRVQVGAGRQLVGPACEAAPDEVGGTICRPELPSTGLASFKLKPGSPIAAEPIPLPEFIETTHYVARVDPKTGALASLKLKANGTELLAGPANVIVADTVAGMKTAAEHFLFPKPKRRLVATSSEYPATIRAFRGPLSIRVHISSDFHGGSRLERRIVFYRDHPRIDFHTRLDLRESDLVVSADFPLAGDVIERARGIPYGFSAIDPRQATAGAILPSIRWSNYQLAGGCGLAILDRGLTGHELNGRTFSLLLINAVSQYMNRPNEMLRGLGVHEFEYAIVPHAGAWQQVNIPRLAYEFNAPVLMATGTGAPNPTSFLETSSNVIVEAMRRVSRQIEVRLYETNGQEGTAQLRLGLPHRNAALTNMMGEKPEGLRASGGVYRFPIRPQRIATLRFEVDSTVPAPVAIRNWASLVPPAKRGSLEIRILKTGHPGR